jgi:peptidoglycan hydrolase-like protein with peptidoglycan-binding domain
MSARFALSVTAAMVLGANAYAADYKPGFPCPRPTNQDLLAVEICSNSEMAKAELTYEKTYYAHRQQDGVQAYKALKIQAIAYSNILRSNCGIPPVGSSTPLPPTAPACYVSQATSQAKEWNASLHGDALQEGERDIDLHIAAQQKLIDLGFLPPKAKADGVYGDGTRIAIVNWQQKQGYPATGFISDSQLAVLLPDNGARPAPPAVASTPLQEPGTPLWRDAPPTPESTAVVADRATAPQPVPDPAPSSGLDEKSLLALVADFHARYGSATNDFQKGALLRQRVAALRQMLSDGPTVTNWIGKIYKLSSNGDGFGVLEITLSDDTWVTTWNNSLSDMDDHTLIKPPSPVYAALGTLSEGDEVVFSGRFVTDVDEVLKTTDLTMNSKMTEPEFLFVFTDVRKR